MGGGKGDIDSYVAPVKPGRIMFEMAGVTAEIAKEALRLAAHKLPVKTRILVRGEMYNNMKTTDKKTLQTKQ